MTVINALFVLLWVLLLSVKRRPDGKWRAVVPLGDGKQLTKHFPLKWKALEWEQAERTKVRQGSWVDPRDPTTVTEYVKQYKATRPHRRSTSNHADGEIRNHIEALPLGKLRLGQVRRSTVQAWVTDRAEKAGPRAAISALDLLRSAFKQAAADGLVASSPCTGVRLPTAEGRPKLVPPTVAQARALADAMPEPVFRSMVITQAGTGLRIGELCGLQKRDLVFLDREPHIRAERQLDAFTFTAAPLKTRSSRRTVPMSEPVAHELARHLAAHPPAAEDSFIWVTPPNRGSGPSRAGQPVAHGRYAWELRKAAKAAGLPHVRSHDLRHHFASVLVSNGVGRGDGRDLAGTRKLDLGAVGLRAPDASAAARGRAVLTAAWTDDVDSTWTEGTR